MCALMRLYIHIPSDPCRRRRMMIIIPATGVMIITMIVMGLITARQGKGHNEGEEPDADEVFYFVFHDG